MKIVNAIAFIALSCLIGVCQSMEKRKSSFRKCPAHDLAVCDSSKYVETMNGILHGIIENNTTITDSGKLHESESSKIKAETAHLSAVLSISQGAKHNVAEGIIPNTEGSRGYDFLKALKKDMFELGLSFEQLVVEEKIAKELCDKHTFHFGELCMIYNKVRLFKKSSEEGKQTGSPKNDPIRNRLSKLFKHE